MYGTNGAFFFIIIFFFAITVFHYFRIRFSRIFADVFQRFSGNVNEGFQNQSTLTLDFAFTSWDPHPTAPLIGPM